RGGPGRKREREGRADGADLEQGEAARRALGLDLKLSVDPEWRLDPPARLFRDQHLASSRERFYAPGQIHVGAYRGVFRTAQRPDIADDHAAGVDADAH